MIKAVIFDLDGTLADTLPDILCAVNGLRAHYGLSPVDYGYVYEFVNGDTEEFVKKSVPGIADDKIDEGIKIYKSCYSKCYRDKTYAYAGMAELLASLKARGIKLAVFSNKADEYVKSLADKLFPGLFDIPLGAGIFASKPSPDGALDIIRQFGVTPDETVFVGDSDVDVKTGNNAGMRVIGVSWGYRGHDFLTRLGSCEVADTVGELAGKLM